MKRIISLLLALVIAISAAVPAYATGDGNMDSGGSGMGDGTKTNYWNPGMDGVRLSVIHADNRAVIGSVVDWSNQKPNANIAHFGKVSKLSYNAGRTLSPAVGGYVCVQPTQKLPKIISTGSSKASIAAIRSYFTDEQVIRAIAGYVGINFDLLISGDYRIVVEPLAYLCYNGQQFAMTATEAALYDQTVNGDLRVKLGSLTHKNLPLAIFLEEADLGYAAWSGSRTDKASNSDILASLGIGIVRFNEVTTPPEPGEYDYEYRVNTEVITSVEVRGGQSDPDDPVSVRFNIQGRTYTVSNVYYPDGDSQLAWVRWRTPAEPCVITISVSVSGGGSAQGTITCNIVDLVAAADLAETRQVHDRLAALGRADDGVVFIECRDNIKAVFREAGVAQKRTAKLARADENGVICVAVAQELLDIGDQRRAVIADLRAAAGGDERKILAHLHLAHVQPRRKRRGGDIDAAAFRQALEISQIGRQALERRAGNFFVHGTASFA